MTPTLLRSIVTSFCWLLLVASCDAQILNFERKRLDNDTTDFTAFNISLDFSLYNRSADAEAPVNLLGFNNNINYIRKRGKHALIFINQNDYLKINESPFLNTGFAHLRGHLWRAKKRSVEVYGQYSYDNFRQLNPRVLSGVNLRYRLIRSDIFTLNAGIGGFFEYERWRHPKTDELVEVYLPKLNTYFSWRLELSENFDYNGTLYYQSGYDPSIDRLRNRIAHTSNFIARISGRLALSVAFEMNYEDRPIVPITPFIFSLRNGLMLTLK